MQTRDIKVFENVFLQPYTASNTSDENTSIKNYRKNLYMPYKEI